MSSVACAGYTSGWLFLKGPFLNLHRLFLISPCVTNLSSVGVTDVTNSTATSASSSPLGSDWVDLKKSELPPGVEEAGAVPVASGGGRWLQAGPSLSRQDSTSSQRQIPNPASPILSDGHPQKRLSGISNPSSSRTSPVSSPRPDHRPLTDAVQRLAVMAAPRTASPALSGDGKLDMSRLSTGAVDSPLFKRIKGKAQVCVLSA